MTDKTNEFKPCPFCGSKDVVFAQEDEMSVLLAVTLAVAEQEHVIRKPTMLQLLSKKTWLFQIGIDDAVRH